MARQLFQYDPTSGLILPKERKIEPYRGKRLTNWSGGQAGPSFYGSSASPIVLLLNTTGTNGSSTDPIIDSSIYNQTITRQGTPTFDTTNKKFICSLSSTAAGCSEYTPTNANFGFGTGDFTIQGWWQPSNSYSFLDKHAVDQTKNGTVPGYRITMQYDGSGDPKPSLYSSGTGTYIISGGSYLVRSTFYHWELTRASGVVYFFQNGVLIGSAASSLDIGATGALSFGGLYASAANAGGRAESWRVIKGFAAHTANFTAPVAQYNTTFP